MTVGAGVAATLAALGLEGSRAEPDQSALPDRPLPVPTDGFIRKAVAIGPGANVIDLSGPWEVFQDAAVAHAAGRFELYTVAEGRGTIEASGGLRIEARGCGPARREDGDDAPPVLRHARAVVSLDSRAPRRRFVEHEHVATAGGLSSGIDLALRVVERYLGRDAADATATYMEYERSSLAIA